MSNPSTALERFYLRVFKVVILLVMSLCLLATLGGLAWAGYQVTRTPKKPEPAKPAPVLSVDPAEFVKGLKKPEPPAPATPEAQPTPQEAAPKPAPKKYLEESRSLVQCANKFFKEIDPGGPEMGEADLESLRADIERVADARAFDRGAPWVGSVAKFACIVLSNPQAVEVCKATKNRRAFIDALNFHIKAWDAHKKAVQEHDAEERDRIRREARAEEARIAEARANGMTALTGAGIAFGVFLALALYLIVAAIESNLRGIHETLDRALPSPQP